jgi:hypothetical protein
MLQAAIMQTGNKTASNHSKEETFITLIRGAGSNVKRRGQTLASLSKRRF